MRNQTLTHTNHKQRNHTYTCHGSGATRCVNNKRVANYTALTCEKSQHATNPLCGIHGHVIDVHGRSELQASACTRYQPPWPARCSPAVGANPSEETRHGCTSRTDRSGWHQKQAAPRAEHLVCSALATLDGHGEVAPTRAAETEKAKNACV